MLFFALLAKFIPDDFGHSHDDEDEDDNEEVEKSTKSVTPKSDHTEERKRYNLRSKGIIEENEEVKRTPKKSKLSKTEKEEKKRDNELRRVGLVTALGISLHNFPEGIAVYLSCLKGIEVGLPIAIAIAAHNIPEGMAVASPIYHSTKSKWQAVKYSLFSGICEPIAALFFGIFLTPYITEDFIHCLLGAVAGIMVLVSLQELLPTAFKYLEPEKAMISLTTGMIFIAMTVFYMHEGAEHDHTGHGHH